MNQNLTMNTSASAANSNAAIIKAQNIATRNAFAADLRRSGRTIQQVADSIGVSNKTAERILKKQNVQKPKKVQPFKVSEKERMRKNMEKMLELRNAGYENGEIASMMGMSYVTVRSYIGNQPKEMRKIHMKYLYEIQRLSKKSRQDKAAAAQKYASERRETVKKLAADCAAQLSVYDLDAFASEIERFARTR